MISRQALPIEFNMSMDISKYFNFIKQYDKWIHSSRQPVKGLPGKPYIVSGITDAFNQLYGLYNKIGVFNGEYGYHQLVLGDRVTTDLKDADCIVISHPFSADGCSSRLMLEVADSFNKPIFVDCAFFGVCSDISFDFSHYKNIHSVCFSLSKTFGTGLNRVGLLYTKDKFPVTIYEQWRYPLITQANMHTLLIQLKTPDTVADKYRDKQKHICSDLGIEPSSTVLFGYSYDSKYDQYKRGPVNRICISALLNEQVKETLDDLDRMGQAN